MGQRQSKEPNNKQQQKQQEQQQRQLSHQPEFSYRSNFSPPTTPTPSQKPQPDPPISEISRPRAPSTLTRLSSLLDPVSPVILSSSPTGSNDWSGDGIHGSGDGKDTSSGTGTSRASQKSPLTIRSPSGNLLGMASYFERPDRPLSMRERQERVRRAMERVQGGESRLRSVGDDDHRSVGEKGNVGQRGLEKESHKRKKSRGWYGFSWRSKCCCLS